MFLAPFLGEPRPGEPIYAEDLRAVHDAIYSLYASTAAPPLQLDKDASGFHLGLNESAIALARHVRISDPDPTDGRYLGWALRRNSLLPPTTAGAFLDLFEVWVCPPNGEVLEEGKRYAAVPRQVLTLTPAGSGSGAGVPETRVEYVAQMVGGGVAPREESGSGDGPVGPLTCIEIVIPLIECEGGDIVYETRTMHIPAALGIEISEEPCEDDDDQDGACCGGGTVPTQLTFDQNDIIGNGTCSDCNSSALAGTYTLTKLADECIWEDPGTRPLCGMLVQVRFTYRFLAGSLLDFILEDGTVVATYNGEAQWLCTGLYTMTGGAVTSHCTGWPATLTIEPV